MQVLLCSSIKLQDPLFIYKNEPNLAIKPFLEGVRLNTGVEAVILQESHFRGDLPAGTVGIAKLSHLLAESSVAAYQTVLNGSSVREILQYLIEESICSNSFVYTYPEYQGIQITLDKATCSISQILMCTWFVSESFTCKRWQQMTDNDALKLVVDKSFFTLRRIMEITEGVEKRELTLDLEKAAKTFLFAYNNQLLKNDISGQRVTNNDSLKFVVANAVLIIAVVITNMFMDSASGDQIIENELRQSVNECKIDSLGRRGLLNSLASGSLIDEN